MVVVMELVVVGLEEEEMVVEVIEEEVVVVATVNQREAGMSCQLGCTCRPLRRWAVKNS